MALISVSNNALQNITVIPASLPSGALILLSTQTASASASISFTSGIDSTYDSYVFKFIDIHPTSDNLTFQFNFSTDGGSNYNVVKTTTAFEARHNEDDAVSALDYDTGQDLAESTSYQNLYINLGGDSDQTCAGTLQLFNPSSATYVKHFISRNSGVQLNDRHTDRHYSGYANTTSPINAIDFKMQTGTFDGIIKMYGVK
jgi:hypothetical protein